MMDLRFILQRSSGNLYWKDREGKYQGANQEYLNLVGLKSIDEILGRTDRELFSSVMSEEKLRILEETDQRIMQTGIEESLREEGVSKDGCSAVYITKKIPLRDGNNTVIGIMGTSLDITKELQADIARTEFLENMGHDIRTPLTGIIGMSQILEQKVSKPEEKQYAHWINESGEQLLSLLNGVLDLISINYAEGTAVQEEIFDIRQAIDSIVKLELPAIKLKDLDIHTDIEDHVPIYIVSDCLKFKRILLNLLGNAVKFTERGFIAIYVNQTYDSSNTKKLLTISVCDSGIGIPEAQQKKVFESFYRGNSSFEGRYSGYGIGLHITQKYIELLSGQIQLMSTPGKGTTFTFSIPLRTELKHDCVKTRGEYELCSPFSIAKASNEPLKKTDIILNNKIAKPFVLLVEDNIIALRLIESLVTQIGGQYTSATTGEEALELAKQNTFDFILSDIGLPGMSGYEMTEKYREWEKVNKLREVPIIGLTAHALEHTENLCLKAGMNEILTKPISLSAMEKLFTRYTCKAFSAADSYSASFLDFDLPILEDDLFKLENYPLIDEKSGIDTLGNKELLAELLTIMINDSIPNALNGLLSARKNDDWIEVENIAHKLKSSALYCGTIRLKFACQYLERYRKAGLSKLFAPLYHQLLQIIDETQVAARSWLRLV